jgi:pyrimidine deaminase RibD-like protein
MKFAEFDQSDYEIHNLTKLDGILVRLCKMLIDCRRKDREYYGMVAAAVLDPDNNLVAKVNFPRDGLRVHAERAAMEAYVKKYGDIPEGSIILTTLSPCSELDDVTADGRYGESCTELINDSIVRKVYCGYMDPSQGDDEHEERDFTLQETNNQDIRKLCKKFADTFLDNVNESVPDINYGIGTSPGKLVRVGKNGQVPHARLHLNISKAKAKKLGLPHSVEENFADGRHPEDKGDSKRHGINTKASVSSLRKTAKQGGRKGQLAHWLANMKAGRAKKK